MSQLNKEQEAAVKAGTHTIDPVHGFVPILPVGAGDPVGDPVTVEADQPSVIEAQAAAVKETEKDRK